jgi:hypothetical protein
VFTVDNPRSDTFADSLVNDIALGRVMTSTGHNSHTPYSLATDGNFESSSFIISGAFTVILDLGADYNIGEIVILLSNAYDSKFELEFSNGANEVTWTSGPIDSIGASVTGWADAVFVQSIGTRGYATEMYVDSAIADIAASDLTGYALESYADAKIATLQGSFTFFVSAINVQAGRITTLSAKVDADIATIMEILTRNGIS